MMWMLVGTVTAIAAAIRGTWSPCGLSMLSTFTPLGDQAKGARYRVTVVWFIAGAALGGAALGLVGAAAAQLVAAQPWVGPRWILAVAAVLYAVGAAVDLGVASSVVPSLPHHRRQVNEQWLDQFRRSIAAAGFGLQIGCGLATYIMTTGVYLTLAAGAFSAQPTTAFGLGVVFGTCRGAAVLAGRHARTPAQLGHLHRRLDELRRPMQIAVATTLGMLGVVLGVAAWTWPIVAASATFPARLAWSTLVAGGVVVGVVSLACGLGARSLGRAWGGRTR